MARPSGDELLQRAGQIPAFASVLDATGGAGTPEVFLVGGAVRDLLCGHRPVDLDFAVEGPLDDLKPRLGAELASHDRFTTATVTIDGVRCDLAQTREERYPQPGALPQVSPADIVTDLKRRDFTVNAIALGLKGDRAGALLAPAGALDDLDARRLSVLHDASFQDDPTRLLRLVRYATRLGFDIEAATRSLADAAIQDGAVQTISGARIGNELRLLAAERDPIGAFVLLHALGLDREIDPALNFTDERATLAVAALDALPPGERRDLLVLATALLDTPARQATDLLDRLEFTAADRDAIAEAAAAAREVSARVRHARSGSDVVRAIAGAGLETVALGCALGPPHQLQRWLGDLRHRKPQITGADLIAAGIPEGPELGRRLAAARDAMLDDEAPDRETQLKVALEQ